MATSRLKTAADGVAVGWLIAAFDREVLHLVPEGAVHSRATCRMTLGDIAVRARDALPEVLYDHEVVH